MLGLCGQWLQQETSSIKHRQPAAATPAVSASNIDITSIVFAWELGADRLSK